MTKPRLGRRVALACSFASIGLTLSLSAPAAFAAPYPAVDAVTLPAEPVPAQPSVQEVANPQTFEQAFETVGEAAGPASQIDPRARAAWLAECRRRANGTTLAVTPTAPATARGYDYCEAYLDDYYRNYSQPTAAYTYQSQPVQQPAQMALAGQTQQMSQPYEEIITEEYVPVYSKPRRAARRTVARGTGDKRIRLYPANR
jgi:hypothetical protein